VKLRQVEGDQPDLVELIHQILMPLGKELLVADDLLHLEPRGRLGGGDAQVVDDHGLRLVPDPKAAPAQPKTEVDILAVGGREGGVEAAAGLQPVQLRPKQPGVRAGEGETELPSKAPNEARRVPNHRLGVEEDAP
jgi:hypothetical protein